MDEFIKEAKSYFTQKQWNEFDESEQLKYGKVCYIYYACSHLGILVVLPDFMTQTRNDKNDVQKTDVTYKCKYCEYTFFLKKDNDKHMKNCRKRFDFIKKKKHACKECNYSTNDFSALKVHYLTHNKEKKYICNYCSKAFSVQSNLTMHIKTIHLEKEKDLKCNKCSYETHRKSYLNSHMRTHLEKEFFCQICNKAVRDIKMHLLRHDKLHKCTTCEKSFLTKRQLTRHTDLIHSKNIAFKCQYCAFSSLVELELKKHSLTAHGEHLFNCSQCEYSTSDKSNYKRHNNVHLMNKSFKCQQHLFKCSQCEYWTSDKSNYRRHNNVHLQNKPFKCQLSKIKDLSVFFDLTSKHQIRRNLEVAF